MNLESLLNLWHLTKKDIDLVEKLREPFFIGKEFEIIYDKNDSNNWWKEPLKHFSSDFSEKNFINSFKSPFISSKDHIQITIKKNNKSLYSQIVNNEEIFSKISEICLNLKKQKKFKMTIQLIKPFQFDYIYSSTQVASILYLFVSEKSALSLDLKKELLRQIIDEEITEISLMEWILHIRNSLIYDKKDSELAVLESFFTKKDVGIMINYLDNGLVS